MQPGHFSSSSSSHSFILEEIHICKYGLEVPNPIMAGKVPSGFVSSMVMPIGDSSSSIMKEPQRPKGEKENKVVVRETCCSCLFLVVMSKENYP